MDSYFGPTIYVKVEVRRKDENVNII